MLWYNAFKLLLATPVSYIGVLVQVLAPLLLTQLPNNVPGMAVDDGPSTWAPATYMGDQDGFAGS